MSVTTKARQRRLGVRQARTSNSANLWTLQSPTAECPVTLSGDLRMKLFFYCEGDASVRDAEYRESLIQVHLQQRRWIARSHGPATEASVASELVTPLHGAR